MIITLITLVCFLRFLIVADDLLPLVDAFDYDLLYETLLKLKAGKNVQVPIYDFKTHSR